MNILVKRLDKRASRNTTNCQAKTRILSTPSCLPPPEGAPQWAVSGEWVSNGNDVEEQEEQADGASTSTVVLSARRTLEYSMTSSSDCI